MKRAILLALLLAGCEPQVDSKQVTVHEGGSGISPALRCQTKMVAGMADIDCRVAGAL